MPHGYAPVPAYESAEIVVASRGNEREHQETAVTAGPHLDANQDSHSDSTSAHPEAEILDTQTIESKGSLTFVNGLALVLGLQIGSGVFTAPSQISQRVPSPGSGVLAWLLGGLFVWTGAASFIELGLTVPRNGGIQEYLRYCYGDFLGFLFTWTWVAISRPCAMAMVSMVFSEHFCMAVFPDYMLSSPLLKLFAFLGLIVTTCVNCIGVRSGALAANGFLILKLLAVFSVALIGVSVAIRGQYNGPSDLESWFGLDTAWKERTTWNLFGNYVAALFGVLFCYGGWETVGFFAGDLKDSQRDLPRVINTAMMIVIIGFFVLNIALYLIIPIETMRTTNTPVIIFGTTLFGIEGGICYSLLVSLSAMGSLNANIFSTARLCVAASKRLYFPAIFANEHLRQGEDESEYHKRTLAGIPRLIRSFISNFGAITHEPRLKHGIPIYALLLNSCLATFYIVIGTFDALVTFYGITEYIFFLLAVLGVFRARRLSSSKADHRTYTFNPCIFSFISSLLIIRGIILQPIQGAAILMVIIAGWIVFRLRFPSHRYGR